MWCIDIKIHNKIRNVCHFPVVPWWHVLLPSVDLWEWLPCNSIHIPTNLHLHCPRNVSKKKIFHWRLYQWLWKREVETESWVLFNCQITKHINDGMDDTCEFVRQTGKIRGCIAFKEKRQHDTSIYHTLGNNGWKTSSKSTPTHLIVTSDTNTNVFRRSCEIMECKSRMRYRIYATPACPIDCFVM